jgi:hypothetical protein
MTRIKNYIYEFNGKRSMYQEPYKPQPPNRDNIRYYTEKERTIYQSISIYNEDIDDDYIKEMYPEYSSPEKDWGHMSLQDIVALLADDEKLSDVYLCIDEPRDFSYKCVSYVYRPRDTAKEDAEYNKCLSFYEDRVKIYNEEIAIFNKEKEEFLLYEKQRKIKELEEELAKLK